MTLVTLALGSVGGLAGHVLGLPAGPLLGALVAVAAFNLATDGRAAVPGWLATGARILLGTVIGSLVTLPLLAALGRNFGWAALFTFVVITVGLVSGVLVGRLTHLEPRTAMIAMCPGGMPEMAALAEEVGAEVDVVLGVHLVRKVLALLLITAAIPLV